MLRKVVFSTLMLMALLAVPLSGALAQGGPPVFCGDLSPEDCEILTQSQAAMTALESVAFDLEMTFSASGEGLDLPEGAESFTMLIGAEGALAFDPEMIAALQSFAEDPASLMANLSEVYGDLLRSFSGNVTLNMALPPEMMADVMPGMESLALELRMAEGVFYVNVGSLMPAESGSQMPSWIGVDVATLYQNMLAESMASAGDMEELFSSDLFSSMYDPEFLGQFVTISRLGDEEMMGQTMAVFHTSLDYAALIASDAFADYLAAVIAMQGEAAQDMPENFDEIMAAIVGGLSVESTQWIGLDDYYVHHVEVDMAFSMDPALLAELAPEEKAGDLPGPFTLTFDLTGDLSDFNEPVEVTIPENAQVIDPMMFMPTPPAVNQ